MIQDIAPHVFLNTYQKKRPHPDSAAIILHENTILVGTEADSLRFPSYRLLSNIKADPVFLFTIDDQDYFWLDTAAEIDLEGYTYVSRQGFRRLGPKHQAFAGLTALQIANWYQSNHYCSRCGNQTERDGRERMVRCPRCGNLVYPRINPAVIVAVTNGDKLLLTKYAGREYAHYALIAGFTEVGETVEETVRREVREEVGVEVKNITYYKSQPWALTDTLLLGFYCELDGEDTIQLDTNELSVAEWLARQEIPTQFEDFALTNEMICRFKNASLTSQ